MESLQQHGTTEVLAVIGQFRASARQAGVPGGVGGAVPWRRRRWLTTLSVEELRTKVGTVVTPRSNGRG